MIPFVVAVSMSVTVTAWIYLLIFACLGAMWHSSKAEIAA
jgi:hypothetical protein